MAESLKPREWLVLQGVARGLVDRTETGRDMLRSTRLAPPPGSPGRIGALTAKAVSTRGLREAQLVADLPTGQAGTYRLTDFGARVHTYRRRHEERGEVGQAADVHTG